MQLSDFVGLLGVPVIVALVEVLKPWLSKEITPIVAIVIGILINLVVAWRSPPTFDPILAVLLGIVAGLAASGLYSGVKAARGL
jgi:hypothetical protein